MSDAVAAIASFTPVEVHASSPASSSSPHVVRIHMSDETRTSPSNSALHHAPSNTTHSTIPLLSQTDGSL